MVFRLLFEKSIQNGFLKFTFISKGKALVHAKTPSGGWSLGVYNEYVTGYHV